MTPALLLLPFIAMVFNLVMTRGILNYAGKRRLYDQPNERTIHTVPVPRLGGIGLFWSGMAVLFALAIWDLVISENILQPQHLSLLFVLCALAIINLVGVYDDIKSIRAITKFFWQGVAAIIVIAGGFYLRLLQIPFLAQGLDLGPVGPILTFFWIIGISNAINLIDGMDGLAGTISLVAVAAYGVYFLAVGEVTLALICFIFVGSLVAFLWFNKPSARIFMGDSGSLFLGMFLAVLPLLGGGKSPFNVSWLLPVTVVLIPLADTFGSIWRRLRDGRSIFSPDKEHTHHKLLQLGLTVPHILWVIGAVQFLLVAPLLLSAYVPKNTVYTFRFWVPMVSIILLLGFFLVLHFIYRRRVGKSTNGHGLV